ncbi:PREDICTED: vacuolar protein sorting-associated protein 11 homolog [Nicrophorus vespilloides]|uniref:Vacuolar protein sorting-associated protein 11 homolog n=1 Tax=Nicrophorus vespilloides TaxID=110193 RepID=A0ABM1N7K5_NICVS|nr:PREDICTED: vacuolar protein sorting-associated protein 11 homolog [Nicrophorus vespilloides]
MAFFEWRKFNFFELKRGVDDGKLNKLFKDAPIAVTTSGNNHLVVGDATGQIHLISRSWQVTSFRAYELTLQFAQQLRNSPLLITIGEDEQGVNPLIKVWDTGRPDKSGSPYCTRITRAIPNNRAVQVSALCVHDNMQMMAVGFVDGSLILYRGDISRDRGSRQKILREASSTVTGLAFKTTANAVYLFVSTENSIYVYNVTYKDKEIMSTLDNIGCRRNCSVITESVQETQFMVARDDAIYCYNSDGRGPCYAADGEKVLLQWFRSYLIFVSKTTWLTPTQAAAANQRGHLLTVLDIQNKFIVFSAPLDEIVAVINEWGGFYIIDCKNTIYHLNEKDLGSKLSLLFKKNVYDIAIRIAKSQQYDSDGLVEIFRQYGDHLYGKGDPSGAIEQYVKTIGKLEPSYVIRKFMDSKHIDNLTAYLQALHKQGQATEDHTTLLLNCFTKLNKTSNLKEFILQKDSEVNFDVDIAIKVCRTGSPEEALMLSKRHKKHDWYIKLLLEDHMKYTEVIEYLSSLETNQAEMYLKKYGQILIQNAPHEATQFLKNFCTVNSTDSDPEDYIHLFLNNSSRLVEFLDYLIEAGCILTSPVYDTLLEHYLHVWESLPDGAEKNRYAQKTLNLLHNPDVKYDKPQALVVCHMHGFSEGILHLYEEQKLYQQILRYHMSRSKEQFDANAVLACCRRFGHQEPTLWVQALWTCIRDEEHEYSDLLPEILNVIAKERLLSPQLVIEAIGSANAEIKLSQVREYIIKELKRENEIANSDKELTNKYRKDTETLRNKVEELKYNPILIQGSRCAACNHTLELPSLHFLCQHSYHQHCFQSYSENENECLACQPDNKKLMELLKSRDQNKDIHETFHSQLDKASDGFTLAAEYFGRGVFNTVKVITDERKPIEKPAAMPQQKQPEKVTEARIRQEENKRSLPAIIPKSEGRIRMQENKFSSSLEANITMPKRPEPKKIEIAAPAVDLNPFGDDIDDEDEYDKEKNPFFGEADDHCDKNLNPFEV